MALLLQHGPVALDAIRAALEVTLQDIPVRLWPDVGERSDIKYALVSRVAPNALAGLPALKLVGSLHSGVDHLLRVSGMPHEIPLTRPVPERGDASMQEYILAQVLCHHRNFPAYARAQRDASWTAPVLVPASSRQVGFLGFGAMAAPAARLLADFGFDVAAWTRRPREYETIPIFHGVEGLAPLAARSQILINLLPLTPATENIIDANLLSQLPRGAALINLGRGEHLVDVDLLAALDRGHIGAATLDVFRTEPLPSDSPLWRHPGISITPHACRKVDVAEVVAQFAEEVRRVERGEAPLRAVDRDAGY